MHLLVESSTELRKKKDKKHGPALGRAGAVLVDLGKTKTETRYHRNVCSLKHTQLLAAIATKKNHTETSLNGALFGKWRLLFHSSILC